MDTHNLSFWEAFNSRGDLAKFGVDALLLFALQLRFGIEDISTAASTSLTEGGDDKKADLVHIDSESRYAVIAQTYISDAVDRKGAPANKASDLNTAISWLLSRPIGDLPSSIKSHAEELRRAILDRSVKSIYIWYVHNLPESKNVQDELTTVEHTAHTAIKTNFPGCDDIEIQALEVGIPTLEDWYKSISTPILVASEFMIPISGGFETGDVDWKAYVTSIPAKWLYEQYRIHKTNLFSANVREYLGSRNADNNINNGIKETAHNAPGHFWVYNNGITVLVHEFEEKRENETLNLYIKGFAIVNGSQTTGAVGNLEKPPADSAKVQVRFITCSRPDTVHDIVKYNNSQNKITASDFRSADYVQKRLVTEFRSIPSVEYSPRRGGYEDVIRRRPNILPSVLAGQALAALHGDPEIAYHEKTHMWEDDTLYSTYFSSQTNAKHIVFAYSLLKAVENKKFELRGKSNNGTLLDVEGVQLEFFRKRGSIFLMTSAIAKCLEIVLSRQLPNLFAVSFKDNLSPEAATAKWQPIVEIASAFTAPLAVGLADGIRNREKVSQAIDTFRSLLTAVKGANLQFFSDFTQQVS